MQKPVDYENYLAAGFVAKEFRDIKTLLLTTAPVLWELLFAFPLFVICYT